MATDASGESPKKKKKKKKVSREDRNRQFLEELKKQLTGSELWQVHTPSGYWICPYCATMGARWQPKAIADMLPEVMGHLGVCRKAERGSGPLLDLKHVKEGAALAELGRKIRKNPAWAVLDKDRHWFCPYNGARTSIVWKGERPTVSELRQIRHYVGNVPSVKGEDGKLLDALSVDQMKVAVLLWTHDHYRCYDVIGRWYHPFRLKPTTVRLDKSKRISRKQIEDVHRLIYNDIDYITSKGQPTEPLERLLDAVRNGQKKWRLARDIKKQVRKDPVWSVVSEDNHWLCPFCREEIGTVDVSNLFLIKRVGSRQMADHLVDDCQAFTTRRDPALSVEELGGVSMLSGERTGGRADYLLAAKALDSIQQSGESDDSGEGILAHRPTPEEAAEHHKAQDMHRKTMEQARLVQLGALPKNPEIPGFEIATHYKAMEEVGGDFYDFVHVSDHEHGIVLGDVSGHGIHAALVMMQAKKAIQYCAHGRSSPKEVMCLVNDDLKPALPPSIFVTIFYGVLNLQTMKLTWVRAGHNPTLVYNEKESPKLQEYEPPGMIVGMAVSSMFGRTLQEHVIDLKPGDLIFQYTDGVTEAMDTERNEYSEERLRQKVIEWGHLPIGEIVEKVNDDVDAFRRGAEPNDDVTMVALRYRGDTLPGKSTAVVSTSTGVLPKDLKKLAVASSAQEQPGPLDAAETIVDPSPAISQVGAASSGHTIEDSSITIAKIGEGTVAAVDAIDAEAIPEPIAEPEPAEAEAVAEPGGGDRRPQSSVVELDFMAAGDEDEGDVDDIPGFDPSQPLDFGFDDGSAPGGLA